MHGNVVIVVCVLEKLERKVFVFRDYICIYMFCLCSGKFLIIAIEKKLYFVRTIPDFSRTENRQQKKENVFYFIIEYVFVLNVIKIYNITFKRYAPILHIKSENVFDRS